MGHLSEANECECRLAQAAVGLAQACIQGAVGGEYFEGVLGSWRGHGLAMVEVLLGAGDGEGGGVGCLLGDFV